MKTKFRPVNTILGSQPRLGPIPADQIIPWFLHHRGLVLHRSGAQPRLAFDWLHCSLGHVHLVDSKLAVRAGNLRPSLYRLPPGVVAMPAI